MLVDASSLRAPKHRAKRPPEQVSASCGQRMVAAYRVAGMNVLGDLLCQQRHYP